MAKKEKVPLKRGEELEAIDLELDSAMDSLSQINSRVVHILEATDLDEALETDGEPSPSAPENDGEPDPSRV